MKVAGVDPYSYNFVHEHIFEAWHLHKERDYDHCPYCFVLRTRFSGSLPVPPQLRPTSSLLDDDQNTHTAYSMTEEELQEHVKLAQQQWRTYRRIKEELRIGILPNAVMIVMDFTRLTQV